jgi:hypothetical protein
MTLHIERSQYSGFQGPLYFGPFNAADLTIVSSSDAEVSENSEEILVLEYCADFVTWIDIAWFRCEGPENAVNAKVRLFRIDDGQTPAAARAAEQWITDELEFSDVAENTKADFPMTSSRGGIENRIEVGGRVGVLFDEPPVGMTDGVIAFRVREARP